ncbi:MAG: putative aminohydrolase SsnA [Clostridia bacterium]
MSTTVYKNAKIFTMNDESTYHASGYITVNDGKIISIGEMKDYQKPEHALEMDLHGMVVLPGNIHSHSHFYGQFVRGIPLSAPMCNWQQILSNMWWKVDKLLDDDMNYYSAMMGLIEGVEAGTTTYIDHQASPNHSIGSLELIEKAVNTVGARAVLAYEVTDRDGTERCKNGIKENVQFIKAHRNQRDGMIQGSFGLHASYTLEDDTLECCAAEASALDVGFHIHVAEDMADVHDSYRRCGKHVVNRLNDFGILGNKTIAAHCVNIGPEQWEIFRENGTMVAHNIQSNMNNAVGIAPVWEMLKNGVCVALGGDGFVYDSFKELSIALVAQRAFYRDPRIMGRDEIDRLLYKNNFKVVDTFFEHVGALITGNAADFIAVDYREPTQLNSGNLYSHLTSGFSGNVDTVVINGNLILKNRQLTTIDKDEVFAKCREHASRLWRLI